MDLIFATDPAANSQSECHIQNFTSVLNPKFALIFSALRSELRIQKDTGNLYLPVAFDLTFAKWPPKRDANIRVEPLAAGPVFLETHGSGRILALAAQPRPTHILVYDMPLSERRF